MKQLTHEIQLVNVTGETLLNFVKTAEKRILIAKPGYTKAEIETLINLGKTKAVECTVYIDPDEKSVRFGFGDLEAIKVSQNHLEILNLQTIRGIRLSIVIVDDKALVYTPAALSWEEEPSELTYPNGLTGGQELVDKILSQFPGPDTVPAVLGNIPIFPTTTIQQVKKDFTKKTLNQTVEALEKNPPVDPSILRQVNIYRNLYKLVKHQIRGVQVRNKALDLSVFNRLFSKSDSHLKRSWQVFTQEDIEKIAQFPQFRKEIINIIEACCKDAGRHGYLIPLSKKSELETNIRNKKEAFTATLNSKTGTDPTLEKSLSESKGKLVNYLNQEVRADPSCLEQLCAHNRIALKRLKDKDCSNQEKSQILAQVIEDFIDDKLRFPRVTDLIDSVDVTLDYYDVSDELLNDEEFKEILTEASIDPRTYTKGFENGKKSKDVA